MTGAGAQPQESAAPRPPGGAPAQTSLRLFVALWPGPRVRQALAACRDLVRPAGSSPVATEKLHLTLHFIGSVPAARLAEIEAGLAVPARAFTLCLDAAEHWRGGVAVLRAGTVPPRLQELHADLAAALRRLALPVEARAFHPHVTLARRAAPRPQSPTPVAPVRWRVTGHALVHSQPDGRYLVLRRYH